MTSLLRHQLCLFRQFSVVKSVNFVTLVAYLIVNEKSPKLQKIPFQSI